MADVDAELQRRVATRQRSSPALRRSSASRRARRESEPWCAATRPSGMRSFRSRARRSAARRLWAKTRVVRCGLDQLGDLLQGRVPHGVARGGEEVVHRRHHLDVEVAREAGVDHDRLARGRPGEKRDCVLDRSHRGRAADALRPRARGMGLDQRLQALQRQDQVRSALAGQHRMDLVDDDEAGLGQGRPEALAREQDVERLGCGDQHTAAAGASSPAGRRPACRPCAPPRGPREAPGPSAAAAARMPASGSAQVLLDVVVERAQRRHVDDVDGGPPAVPRHRAGAGGRAPTGRRPASCPSRSGPR